MGFNDVFGVEGGLSLPRSKYEQMLAHAQLEAIGPGLVRRVAHRKIGAFTGFEGFFDRPGPFRVTPRGDRVELVFAPGALSSVSPAELRAASTRPPPAPGVTVHAAERWRERVVPHLRGAEDSSQSIREWLARSQEVHVPFETREAVKHYQLDTSNPATGWVRFTLDTADDSPRVLTITTLASFVATYSDETRQRLTKERQARAAEVSVRPLGSAGVWQAVDPDQEEWEVTTRAGTPIRCSCPDFQYKAGPAGIPCKHMLAVRARS